MNCFVAAGLLGGSGLLALMVLTHKVPPVITCPSSTFGVNVGSSWVSSVDADSLSLRVNLEDPRGNRAYTFFFVDDAAAVYQDDAPSSLPELAEFIRGYEGVLSF